MNQNSSSNADVDLFQVIKNIFYIGFLIIFVPFYIYFNTPIINLWFPEFSFSIIWITAIAITLEVLNQRRGWLFKTATTTAVITGIYIVIMTVSSWAMFRASAYRSLIGEVKQGENFSENIAPISVENIRIVDEDVADRLGDKVLGEDMALGSRAYIGSYDIQKIGNHLYWVAPLLHSGIAKWYSNSEGTPGYVLVSATNERDAQLVLNDKKGRPIRIKYQPEGYFGDNLYRHLYFNGYATAGMTDFTFEVDDDGRAYWVVSLYRHEVGFSGDNVYGILVVDAETGDIQEYTPETAPMWIDRIQPKDIVQTQLDSWGEYVHGFWNFSNADVLTTTDGISLVYGSNDQSYFYTGLTSVGSDEGTVGFVLVNTRTKEATWYQQSGATEIAAQTSAEGKVQEKGYTSSFPILYNINGIPTYVMSLKDKSGLIKMIAMVSIEDYSIVGVGNDLKEALRAYKAAYSNTGNANILSGNDGHKHSVQSRVVRIATDISGGTAYYYLTVDDIANKIFIGTTAVSPELPLTQVNDSVTFTYEDGRTATVDLVSFDNAMIRAEATDSVAVQ